MLYCMKNYFVLNSTHPQFHTKFSRIRFPYRDHHIIIINCNGQSMLQTTSYPLLYHTQAGRPASLAWTWPASIIWDALWHVRLSYVTERESTDLWNTYVILNWHQWARQGILRSSAFSAWFSPISQKLSLISKVWAILHCQSRGRYLHCWIENTAFLALASSEKSKWLSHTLPHSMHIPTEIQIFI